MVSLQQFIFFTRTIIVSKSVRKRNLKQTTSLNDGSLGSEYDEERSEMRYVV